MPSRHLRRIMRLLSSSTTPWQKLRNSPSAPFFRASRISTPRINLLLRQLMNNVRHSMRLRASCQEQSHHILSDQQAILHFVWSRDRTSIQASTWQAMHSATLSSSTCRLSNLMSHQRCVNIPGVQWTMLELVNAKTTKSTSNWLTSMPNVSAWSKTQQSMKPVTTTWWINKVLIQATRHTPMLSATVTCQTQCFRPNHWVRLKSQRRPQETTSVMSRSKSTLNVSIRWARHLSAWVKEISNKTRSEITMPAFHPTKHITDIWEENTVPTCNNKSISDFETKLKWWKSEKYKFEKQ